MDLLEEDFLFHEDNLHVKKLPKKLDQTMKQPIWKLNMLHFA